MGKSKKLTSANLENSINVQKQPPEMLYKSFSLTGWNGVRYNCFKCFFISFWYCYICILFRSSRTEVFAKFTRKHQAPLLSAVSNFINEETLARCFPKPLTIFAKNSIVDVRLGYKYASVLPPDLKPICKDFLL